MDVLRRQRASRTRPVDAPPNVERALRRVRTFAALLVTMRVLTASDANGDHAPWLWAFGLGGALAAVSLISLIGERDPNPRVRTRLGAVELAADIVIVLVLVWFQPGTADSADWAILVLPVLEGAIRFQFFGAIVTWAALTIGYVLWNLDAGRVVEFPTLAQRLTVVFIVAAPTGYLSQHLIAETEAHRRGRAEAERRGALLRTAALGGRHSTTLDVDEVLTVLRGTLSNMGFLDVEVFEIDERRGTTVQTARPVRHANDVVAIPPGDPRLAVAAAARDAAAACVMDVEARVARADGLTTKRPTLLVAAPVTPGSGDESGGVAVVTARWPHCDDPPAAELESLELFSSQAGASLQNAQRHEELQVLKDRLAHEASHDALTELPNRRRFHEQLERMCGRGRPTDFLAVLFLDLDGFKQVNDELGHDAGNELLVAVARQLRDCVRPGDLVARMGGDEFTILLTRLDGPAPAIEVAERVCELVAEPFVLEAGTADISTSIGIALALAIHADPGDLVRRADVAMYRAKRQGKAGWALDPATLPPMVDRGVADSPG